MRQAAAEVELSARTWHHRMRNRSCGPNVRRTDFRAEVQLPLPPSATLMGWARIGPQVTFLPLPSLFPRQRPQYQVLWSAAQLAQRILHRRPKAYATRLARQHVGHHIGHLHRHIGVRAAKVRPAST